MVQLNSTMISHKSVYCVCSGPCLCIEESLVDQNRGTLSDNAYACWMSWPSGHTLSSETLQAT